MKVSFYLKDPQADYDTWIFCMVSYQNKRVKIYTDEKINPQFWNKETQRARQTTKFPNYPEFNKGLNDIISSIDRINLEWKSQNSGRTEISPMPSQFLKEKLRRYLTKTTKEERVEEAKKSFWGFYDIFLERMQSGTRVHLEKGTPISAKTIFQFHNLNRHLRNFENKSSHKINLDTIDLAFYKSFVDYLTKLQLGPNTIGKLITNLKVFLREALEEGITNNTVFTHRKFKSINFKSETVYLTNEEINELHNLDLTLQPRLDRVRDIFIVGCYTGLRFSDLIKIKPQNIEDGMIEIVQSKTNSPVIIPLTREVLKILEKYKNSLPRISNQKFNKYLSEVCQKCSLLQKEITINKIQGGKKLSVSKLKHELVSCHTARRSFCTNEYKAGYLEINEIMTLTGHKTEKAFYRYIRETPKEKAMRIKQKFTEREQKENTLRAALVAV